jgi:hypothetical protein
MSTAHLNSGLPFFHEERYHALGAARRAAITLCGAGSIGANLVETLARMGFERLRVIDRDRVEMRNLSTQPYVMAEAGTPKAQALANHVFRAVRARVEPVSATLTATNAASLLAGASVVVDAFDNQEARAAASSACLALDLPCLHAGLSGDGLYGSGVWEPGYRLPGPAAGDPCDYPLTRPFALVVAALAARSLHAYLCRGVMEGFEITWADAHVTTAGA